LFFKIFKIKPGLVKPNNFLKLKPLGREMDIVLPSYLTLEFSFILPLIQNGSDLGWKHRTLI